MIRLAVAIGLGFFVIAVFIMKLAGGRKAKIEPMEEER